MDPLYKNGSTSIAYAQPLIYDDNCSCGFNSTSTTAASFNETQSAKLATIKGLKMGCTPSESFLASTLECFYDLSCINLIQEITHTNDTDVPIPLNLTNSRFAINTNVNNLVKELFVERPLTTDELFIIF
jgi:hypothetical protein